MLSLDMPRITTAMGLVITRRRRFIESSRGNLLLETHASRIEHRQGELFQARHGCWVLIPLMLSGVGLDKWLVQLLLILLIPLMLSGVGREVLTIRHALGTLLIHTHGGSGHLRRRCLTMRHASEPLSFVAVAAVGKVVQGRRTEGPVYFMLRKHWNVGGRDGL